MKNSKQIYNENLLYSFDSFPKNIDNFFSLIEIPGFLKQDDHGFPFILKKSKLQQVSLNGSQALFLADIFASRIDLFLSVMNDATNTLKIDFKPLSVPNKAIPGVMGWVDPLAIHHAKMEALAEIIIKKNKSFSFSEFVEQMMSIIIDEGFEMTRIHFLKTKMDVFNSGLAFKFNPSPADDHKKKNQVIQSPVFKFYSNMLQKHGLRMDKEVPWIVMADLTSENYNINFHEFFKEYSEEGTLLDDFYAFVFYFINIWNVLSLSKPFITKPVLNECNELVVIQRLIETVPTVNGKLVLDIRHWLRLYCVTRCYESLKRVDNGIIEILINNINIIFNIKDLNSSLIYLNNSLNNVNIKINNLNIIPDKIKQ